MSFVVTPSSSMSYLFAPTATPPISSNTTWVAVALLIVVVTWKNWPATSAVILIISVPTLAALTGEETSF